MRFFAFCLALSLAASALGAELKINFGDYADGQTPTNFHAALAGSGQPGAWKIVRDAVPSAFTPLTDKAPAFTRQSVLAQTSQDPDDNRFPLFIYDGETFQDFNLTMRFKIVSGITEQMAGLVFHFQNSSNFYVFRASALGHNVRFYKVVNGEFLDPKSVTLDIATGDWHTLTVQCEGNAINCGFDGRLVMPLQTTMTFNSGKIGFWTKSDSVTYFGDTLIEYKPRIPAAQALVNSILAEQPRILGLRLYQLDDKGQPHIIASKDETEIGQPGDAAEKNALTDGTVSFGKSAGVVAITLPLRDRNGDPIAAVRLRLKSFFGETQENAVTRATLLIKKMQAQVTTADELAQ